MFPLLALLACGGGPGDEPPLPSEPRIDHVDSDLLEVRPGARFSLGFDLAEVPADEAIVRLRLDHAEVAERVVPLDGGAGVVTFDELAVPVGWADGSVHFAVASIEAGAVERSSGGRPLRVSRSGLRAGLDALSEASTGPVRVRPGPAGFPDTVHVDVEAADPRPGAAARAFLEDFGGIWGLDDPAEQTATAGVRTFEDGEDVVVFEQRHLGWFVEGAELRVQLRDGRIRRVTADLTADRPSDATPAVAFRDVVPPADAWSATSSPQLVWIEPRLWSGGLLDGDRYASAGLTLAWKAAWSERSDRRYTVYHDARTGVVLSIESHQHECGSSDKDLETFDANNSVSNSCFIWDYYDVDSWCTESGCDGGTPAYVRDLHDNADRTYEWFHHHLCRRSYDGDDTQFETFARYDGQSWNNAAWMSGDWCDIAVFGPGWTPLDTVAHEFTHGMIHDVAGIRYRGESGALNEHIADFFGGWVNGSYQRDDSGTRLQPERRPVRLHPRRCLQRQQRVRGDRRGAGGVRSRLRLGRGRTGCGRRR